MNDYDGDDVTTKQDDDRIKIIFDQDGWAGKQGGHQGGRPGNPAWPDWSRTFWFQRWGDSVTMDQLQI